MASVSDLQSGGCARYASAAAENSHQVSTTQSIMFGFDGSNTDTSNAIFVQVFDSATTPAANAVPVINISVPPRGTGTSAANGNFGYSCSTSYGEQFSKGIFIAASSTDGTFTAVATSKTLFHVQFAHEDGSGNL